ncbi:MAG: YgjV family protein [Oscillospiraceae bacterium]|nr:YgjV family protein [Oscillospiraceae bacterium]
MISSAMLIQGIGFIAVTAFILSYQIQSNRWLFLLQLIGSALFCLQFFMLDAKSGCLSLAVNILRNALMMKYNEWKWVRWKGCPFLIAVCFTTILFFTWNGYVSLLAYLASVSSTFVYWTNSARNIRLVNLACASPCWLVYDVIVHSWGGIVSESITILSILVSIFRFGWKGLESDSKFKKQPDA